MSDSRLPPTPEGLRLALRRHADAWIQRFYRHELLVARAVRGIQDDAAAEFRREVVVPLVKRIAAGMATFERRGSDVLIETTPELRRIITEAEVLVRNGMIQIQRTAKAKITELVRQEVGWTQESARKVLKLVETRPISLRRIETAVEQRPYLGAKTEEWFNSIVGGDNGVIDNVRFAVQTGVQRGWSTDEVVRVLRGTKATGYTDGLVSGANENQLRAMVRTAATHASTTARTESFQELGVKKWRFVAVLDSRTSIQCAANDGKVFDIGEGPLPPLHPNCRSNVVPYTGEPIGERASVDGPVPASTNFRTWLKDQPEDVQDEMLGPSRAAAWRAGDLTFEQMVGTDMLPLTVKELIAKDRIPDPEDE